VRAVARDVPLPAAAVGDAHQHAAVLGPAVAPDAHARTHAHKDAFTHPLPSEKPEGRRLLNARARIKQKR